MVSGTEQNSHDAPVYLRYLVEVLLRGSHLLPGFVEQLNTDTEEFLQQSILTEEDGMVVGPRLRGCRNPALTKGGEI